MKEKDIETLRHWGFLPQTHQIENQISLFSSGLNFLETKKNP